MRESLGRAVPAFVCDLMAKNYEAIGFLPRPRIEHYAERNQILTASEGGDLCGYLLFGGGWPVLKVYQTCIDFDARRLDHASHLVVRLKAEAQKRHCSAISLWCAEELEANRFWIAVGFIAVERKLGGVRRGRMLIRWVHWLANPSQLRLPLKASALEGL